MPVLKFIPLVVLAFILIGGLISMFDDKYMGFIKINKPYQRFRLSMRRLHFSILQHWLIRFQFSQKDLLPLRLLNFLNEMSKIHIMESDGANWRFRHQMLQDYFAKQWEESDQIEDIVNANQEQTKT